MTPRGSLRKYQYEEKRRGEILKREDTFDSDASQGAPDSQLISWRQDREASLSEKTLLLKSIVTFVCT